MARQHGMYDEWTGEGYTGGGLGEVGRYAGGLLQSLTGRNPDLLDAADEVAADQSAHIFLASPQRELPRRLLAALRRAPVAAYAGELAQHGVWLLATLPTGQSALEKADAAHDEAAGEEAVMDTPDADTPDADTGDADAGEALLARLGALAPDIVLYLVALGDGWRAVDTAWVARLRTLGAPLLPVVIAEAETAPEELAMLTAAVRGAIGLKPLAVALAGAHPASPAGAQSAPPADRIALIERIVALRPRVAVALAQDIVWCRARLARRIIYTGALLTALVSAQPVPLLDLPFQVALQWKVAMQIAAIYGRPGLDYRSGEMMGTIAWNLVIRFAVQQAARFVPVAGWGISAAIGWLGTLLLGHALVTIYEHEDRWNLEEQGRRVRERAEAATAPVRAASERTASALRSQAAAVTQQTHTAGQRLGAAWRVRWPRRAPQAVEVPIVWPEATTSEPVAPEPVAPAVVEIE